MSTVTDLSVLKINYLTQQQYDNELSNGTVNQNELYLTPAQGSGVSDVEVDGVSVVSGGVADIDLTGKQDTLVSGTNIKTINNQSLLGSGDITISGGGSTENVTITSALSSGLNYTATYNTSLRRVHIDITLNTSSDIAMNTTMATIQSGYRPTTNLRPGAFFYYGSSNTPIASRLYVNTDGTIKQQVASTCHGFYASFEYYI